METRIIEFVRTLRAAGVRISLAESQDAMRNIEAVGVMNPLYFQEALRTAVIKERRDQEIFDYFFPLYFSSGQPPLLDINEQLSPDEQQMLQDAMQQMMSQMQSLRDLLDRLMEGEGFSQEELEQLGKQSGLPNGDAMYQRAWFERRMLRQSGLAQLERILQDLLEQLEEMGMDQETLGELAEMLQENMQGLAQQISNFVGSNLAEQMGKQERQEPRDLQDIPFYRLNQQDMDAIRDEIRRLAARLRTRASMRQKRAKSGTFDPRKVLRQNMRYGGVPLELPQRIKHKKPSLVVICDVSTSMRPYVEFLLTLVYELQDQIRRTNSFIFISDMIDISMEFQEYEPREAVSKILRENPPGYYSTDLGNSLNTFSNEHMSKIDHRTTVVILGDGRNNYNNPRLDIVQEMRQRSNRLIWFCPESQSQWGTGDSDMWEYATFSDGVFLVNTLGDLASAIDRILVAG